MTVSPMIVRELKAALRNRGIGRSRLGAAAAAGGLTAFFLLLSFSGGRLWGRMLQQYLFILGLVFGVLRPAQLCLGLFTQERRGRMLELLYLTGIGPTELFVSKALGGVLVASTGLLAMAPFFAVPFLSGGISLELFLATIAVLPVLLLFAVSLTILSSALSDDEGGAAIFAGALGLVIILAVPIIFELGRALTGSAPFSPSWLSLSPGYAGLLIFKGFGAGGSSPFWTTAGVTLVWSFLFLALAAVGLARSWRNTSRENVRPADLLWVRLMRGGKAARDCLLGRNPFQWLAQRDRRPVMLAWGSVLGICLLWLGGWCAWPRYWPSTINFFVTATLMVLAVEGLQLHAAARPLAESRQDGTLELLLTTPLSPAQILEGQLAALRTQFRLVRLFMLGLFGVMIWWGFKTRPWTIPAMMSYFGIWCIFIIWCSRSQRRAAPTAMWVGLITGRASYAVYRSQGGGYWWWFWIFWNFKNLRSWIKSAASFPSGSDAELIVIALLLMMVLLYSAFAYKRPPELRAKFIEEMRTIAQHPVPARDDPRLKQWKNVKEPFPIARVA